MNSSLRQYLSRAILCLVLLLLLPRIANACGCFRTSTVLDDYQSADLVVIARMKTVIKGKIRYFSDISHVTMEVEKVYKGDVKIGDELTFLQGDAVLNCSWDFVADWIGEKFLFYLYRPEKPGEPFVVSTCNRSTGLEAANDDLLYLENIDRVKGRTRISGVLEVEDEPTAGEQVRITGKNKTYIATTDKNGVYELYDLPPGRYSVEPVLKFGWKIYDWHITRQETRAEWRRSNLDLPPLTKRWFTLRAGKHFGADIRLELANRIAGRITSRAGKPLQRVCVTLVRAEESEEFRACNDFSNADGTFAVDSLDAGAYKLIVNYENIKSNYQPFPKLYYPGVERTEEAKVLTVKFGESIEGLNFVVPTLAETVKLEGVVRYSNGRPASKIDVRFNTPKIGEIDGSIEVQTDNRGRFAITVLKGSSGQLYSIYMPDDREVKNCAPLKRSLHGNHYLETPRLQIVANENQTFELKLPASPCR